MKHVKLFEDFLNDKWMLGINESIFDKIETLVKGKSEKGKIIQEFLTRNAIPLKGNFYGINYLGGAEPGKKEMSNPIDYLQYTAGLAVINSEGLLELTDEKSKALQVPDTIAYQAAVEKKEDIAKNFTFGLKPGSAVNRTDYEFDLSKDIPTLTTQKNQYSIPQQKWNPIDELKVVDMDEDISEINDDYAKSFFVKNQIKMISLQQWVDELNKTGWVKEDKDYFTFTEK